MPKKKKPRERRVFTDEQKRAIIAEIGPKKTMAAVARKHDIHPPLLSGWRVKLAAPAAPAAPAEAPASQPPPSSNGGNGSAPVLAVDPGNGPRLSVHGLGSYIRTVVREELRPIVREELAKILQAGAG